MPDILTKSSRGVANSDLIDAMMLVLREIVSQAVVSDRADYDEFKNKVEKCQVEFETSPNPNEVARAVCHHLKQYNDRALKTFRSQGEDLEAIVSSLIQAMSSLSSIGEQSKSRLESLRNQVRKAATLDDIRRLRVQFGLHLDTLQEEGLSQQAGISDMVSGVIAEFRRIQDRARESREVIDKSILYASDTLTGLPAKGYAEAILAEAHSRANRSFVTVFVVERVELVSHRFGVAAADQLLLYFSQHLAQNLSNGHNLFRWAPAAFISFIASSDAQENIRREVQNVALRRIEKLIEIGERTALIPISCKWLLIPVVRETALEALFRQINTFVSLVSH
jgi:GGDEF domain-containing protein